MALAGGEVYVTDANDRVNVFTPVGAFVRAFGKGVDPGGGDVCNTASGCQAGSPGAAAGQLNAPDGVAVSGGEVYVGDSVNRRISVFTTAGAFDRAFGKGVNPVGGDVCTSASGCQSGTAALGGPAS